MSRNRENVHEEYAHQILSEIEAGNPISQRSLSSSLGIALGMTNLLLRRLVRKGWVRVSHIRPNRVGYFLTPTGMAEKARMSRAYFVHSVKFYSSARERIRARFAELSNEWPDTGADALTKAIVFVGAGEASEIAYVCLQETDLKLVGVIDFHGRDRFFGLPVYRAAEFRSGILDEPGRPRPVLVAFSEPDQISEFLANAELAPEEVFWV